MTTVQIIGIAVAAARGAPAHHRAHRHAAARGRGRAADEPRSAPATLSFLDEAPQDTFAKLGKAEQPVEDITIDPALERAAAARRGRFRGPGRKRAAAAAAGGQPGGLGLDWGPDLQRPHDRPRATNRRSPRAHDDPTTRRSRVSCDRTRRSRSRPETHPQPPRERAATRWPPRSPRGPLRASPPPTTWRHRSPAQAVASCRSRTSSSPRAPRSSTSTTPKCGACSPSS